MYFYSCKCINVLNHERVHYRCNVLIKSVSADKRPALIDGISNAIAFFPAQRFYYKLYSFLSCQEANKHHGMQPATPSHKVGIKYSPQ